MVLWALPSSSPSFPLKSISLGEKEKEKEELLGVCLMGPPLLLPLLPPSQTRLHLHHLNLVTRPKVLERICQHQNFTTSIFLNQPYSGTLVAKIYFCEKNYWGSYGPSPPPPPTSHVPPLPPPPPPPPPTATLLKGNKFPKVLIKINLS